jgi:site-specific recombinase XerD
MNKVLGKLLHGFFEDYLKCQKGLRHKTIQSYRDVIRLFLLYVTNELHCKITRLSASDLTSDRVRCFLRFLEEHRNNTIQTRNQRLAALHTFFEYLAQNDPLLVYEAQQVAAIPVKRCALPETIYLDQKEITKIFREFPSNKIIAIRDHALLLFLYNTGARAGEVSELKIENLELTNQLRVHLHGKGDKWRICPLWVKTVTLLKKWLEIHPFGNKSKSPVFINVRGNALTRFGIYKIVRRHTASINKKGANGKIKYISPHIMRHSTSVHLLEAGVDVNVIRAWLGHASLETTNRYAEITPRIKEEALKTCEPFLNISEEHNRKPIWRDDTTLLKWLESI